METEKQYFKNTSYASRSTLESLLKKMDRIKKYRQHVLENAELISILDDKQWQVDGRVGQIIENFCFFCESIYSCMDYLGYLIYIYQSRNGLDRGGKRKVQSSFHDIIDIYTNQLSREECAIFKCHELCDVMSSIVQWYYDIRLIRSKETHYNTGQILKKDGDIIYDNHVVYGDHDANNFNLSSIDMYYDNFTRDVKAILELMDTYKLGFMKR
jgi:hypothetical protein